MSDPEPQATPEHPVYDRLREKLGRDPVLVLASGIAFNALVAVVPLALLATFVVGVVVESSADARSSVLEFLLRWLPLRADAAREVLFGVVQERGWIGILGGLGLVWAATRLFGSLRSVLEVVFEIPPADRPGFAAGKIHDARMVVVVGSLLVLTLSITSGLQWLGSVGVPASATPPVAWIVHAAGAVLAFAATLLMFFVLYRAVPRRRIERFDAAVGATFSAVLFEIAKVAFLVTLSSLDRYAGVYGSFAGLVALAIWAYWGSAVFVLGAEIASARRWAVERWREANRSMANNASSGDRIQ